MSSISDFHENVLGRRCMLVSQGRCRRGTISKFQSERKSDGSFERRHLVIFDNRESTWVDLAHLITEERLWLDTPKGAYSAEESMNMEGNGDNYDAELSEETVVESIQVVPDDAMKRARQSSSKRGRKNTGHLRQSSSSDNQHLASRKVPKHSHPGVSLGPSTPLKYQPHTAVVSPVGAMRESTISDTYHFSQSIPQSRKESTTESNCEWLEQFEYWLLNIPHGRTNKVCSEDNARNVMKQVRKLVIGDGIGYRHWPSHVKFYEGVKVNLHYDFEKMHCEAKAYESRFGKDKGRGWLLRHPIEKLLLFKTNYFQTDR